MPERAFLFGVHPHRHSFDASVYSSVTGESRYKGDEGFFAGVDAKHLIEIMHVLALERDAVDDRFTSWGDNLQLGVPRNPGNRSCKGVKSSAEETAEQVLQGVLFRGSEVATYPRQTPIDIPDAIARDELKAVMHHVRAVQPRRAMSYDNWLRLLALLRAPDARITTLRLSGILNPAEQPDTSSAQLASKVAELKARYPLPPPPTTRSSLTRRLSAGSNASVDDSAIDSDEDGVYDEEEQQHSHNAKLKAIVTEKLHLPYESYHHAIEQLAQHETRVFPLLCDYLAKTGAFEGETITTIRNRGIRRHSQDDDSDVGARERKGIRVLLLDRNGLGAEHEDGTVDAVPLRALGRMIDMNQSVQVLSLADNQLRPRSIGIVAKALTKSISLVDVDFSGNSVNPSGEPELTEDPTYAGEDAVFGEVYSGLEALGEVLKKNKFIRALRLARMNIHAGDDLAAPVPEDNVMRDFHPESELPRSKDEATADHTNAVRRGTSKQNKHQRMPHRNTHTTRESDQTPPPTTGARIAATQGSPSCQHMDTYAEMLADALESTKMRDAVEGWSDTPLWKLIAPLQTYHRLEILDLTGNMLCTRGARMLAVALATNRSLHVLDLTDNQIGFRGLHYLAGFVLSNPQSVLHTLVLRRNNLSGKRSSRTQQKAALAAMQAFADALRDNRVMRRLTLANNRLGPALSAALLSTIGTATALEELDFECNDACGENATTFDPTVAHLLARALHSFTCHTNHNTSNDTGRHERSDSLGDDGGRDCARRDGSPPALTSCCFLQTLRLGDNNLGPAGCDILFPRGFALPYSLRALHLSRNGLGDQLGCIGNALLGSTTLHTLDLSYNNIYSASAMMAGLRSSTTLRHLDVSHNKLGSVGEADALLLSSLSSSASSSASVPPHPKHFEELVRTLAESATLASVNLCANDLGPAHAEILERLLATPSSRSVRGECKVDRASAPALRRLDLRDNPKVAGSQVTSLVQTLGKCAGLQVLYLTVPNSERDASNHLLEAMHDAVTHNYLLDIDCAIRPVGSELGMTKEGKTHRERLIDQMRHHLLLHSLLADAEVE